MRSRFCAGAVGEGAPPLFTPAAASTPTASILPRITAANRKLHTAPPCPLDCFTSGAGQLEIVAPGVNKGAGLARAAALLGIPQEETIAIGDGENDISMLRWAGLGIAMANAPDNVKAAADVIAPVCDEDGAAWAMEKYLL